MIEFVPIIKCLALSLLLSYGILFFFFFKGWLRGKTFIPQPGIFSTKVSIILPIRNEEHNLANMLNALSGQDYPPELFEIIVVDDGSEDKSGEIVKAFARGKKQIKLIRNNSGSGKKGAVSAGIKESSGELILTTDADCLMGIQWLSSIVSFYEKEKPEMIIAPVVLRTESSFFGKIQALEFLSLSGITAASAFLGKPLLCNGANLAYSKKAFLMVKGFEENMQTPSGDDMFLMLKFKKLYPGKIMYLKSEKSIVSTSPQQGLKQFIEQRKRWVSKNSYFKELFLNFTSWIILLFNLSVPVFIILTFLNNAFAEILLVSFSSKLFIDFLFLFLTASFFKQKSLLWYYLAAQLMYIVYVPYISVAGLTGKFIWKGRLYNG